MSYSGDMEGCHACARTDNGRRNMKIELEFWKQNSQKPVEVSRKPVDMSRKPKEVSRKHVEVRRSR